MLLNQRRNKVIMWIMAIFATIAFLGGVIALFVLVIFFPAPSVAEQALDVAKVEVSASPKNPQALMNLASAYDQNNQPKQAIDAAKKALAVDPGNVQALQLLISLRQKRNDTARSLAVAEEFTKKNPKEPEGFIAYGALAEQDGKNSVAQFAYAAALNLDPDGPNADDLRSRIKDLAAGKSAGAASGAPPGATP